MLPDSWSTVSRFNPVFYIVNGLRYGMLGISDVAPGLSLAILLGLALVVLAAARRSIADGTRLRL